MKLPFVALMLLAASGVAEASGDAAAGQKKAEVCAACHGADGNSVVETFPRLAGQHESYLLKQLVEIKQGAESNGEKGRMVPEMIGMVLPLSEQDMADIAAFYASQTAFEGTTPENIVAAGDALYRGGDLERKVAACLSCHGPRGVGHSLAKFPRISGQHPAYTKTQLQKFRSGERANDPNGMMRDVAAKLTDAEIELLSQYLVGLH